MNENYGKSLNPDREETIKQFNKFIQNKVSKSKHFKLREAANGWNDEELASFVRRNGFEPVFRRG